MSNQLHLEILPAQQKKIFNYLRDQKWLSGFYLAGGTALALQIGHRQSVDFDFFSNISFENEKIIEAAAKAGKFELFSQSGGTVNGALNDVPISFFYSSCKLLETPIPYGTFHIAGMLDIALMKLTAISSRGSKKDFIDLYFLLNYFPLSDLFKKYPRKYGRQTWNKYHLLKSLVYFEDAEKQPMPRMHQRISWSVIKKKILSAMNEISLR